LRARGIRRSTSISSGLPHQTGDSVAETLRQVLALRPERIAIFGYAHLPARLKHQRMIADDTLPGAIERFDQSNRLAELLLQEGFVRVGLDHFALPSDPLASQPVSRNFRATPPTPPRRFSGSAPRRSAACRRAMSRTRCRLPTTHA
jgi:oxygen-independent coproporphyrinogen-3 oxidase